MLTVPTFRELLQRMIDRVLLQYPEADTREGSIIYNALAPTAVELRNAYILLNAIMDETFADTASREMLIKRALERGLSPYPATKAIGRGVFTPASLQVPIGSRFSLQSLNWVIVDRAADGIYTLQCETEGTAGNENTGALVPIEYIAGLETARLTEILIPGEDVEDTEAFRQRYFDSLDGEAYGGNVRDYKEKTAAIPGVGGVKVYPVWNGGGTVRLVVIASDFSVPTSELIDGVQTRMDPVPNNGQGLGLAPIGHVVTVEGVASTVIDIATTITYQDGWTWPDVQPYAEEAVDAYFAELASGWDAETNVVVRISQLETRFLNLPGIVDIADTLLNGLAQNAVLGADSIPERGGISG